MRRTPSATGSPSASSNRRARSRRVERTLPAATAAPAAASAPPVAASARESGVFAWVGMLLREVLVLVVRVVCHLATEPRGRRERLGAALVRELGFDDDQALVVSPIAVQFEHQAVRPRDPVAALLHAAVRGQRPEAFEAIAGDRELLLGARAPGALLDRHHGIAVGPPP